MLTFGSLFTGVGLLDFGLCQAGIRHAWFCESDEWRRGILRQRWPGVPVYPDVRAIGGQAAADARGESHGAESGGAPSDATQNGALRGVGPSCSGGLAPVDGIVGGFPCKGASTAGKREGFGHPETVLWREMARIVRNLRPRYVLLENVAAILAIHDGAVWGEVLGDLAACGYAVEWDCLPAAAVGAPHRRDRVFAVARLADGVGWGEARPAVREGRSEVVGPTDGPVADPAIVGSEWGGPARGWRPGSADGGERAAAAADTEDGGWAAAADAEEPGGLGRDARPGARGVPVEWGEYQPAITRWEHVHGPAPEPLIRRVDDRSAARVDRSRLSALGDGVQVQIGRLVGGYVLDFERRRLADAA